MNIQSKKAFTLVELIVVIIIISILGTIAFISIQGYSKSARDTKRISDIQNIKKSLELFTINTGKYPLPDNPGTVSYSGDLLRTQGTIGNQVSSNLSKNLQKKPTDPLTEIEYTYSVTNIQKEYEVMAIFETSEYAKNGILNNTYADGNYTPRIDGNYNQIFVKTPNYIVPTPTIINAEPLDIQLNQSNLDPLKSGIITGGDNMLDTGISSISTATGQLDITPQIANNITLESSDTDKALVITAIQNTYSGSSLANNDIYKPILLATTESEKAQLANSVVLKTVESQNITTGGILLPTRYPGCNTDDFIIGSFTVAACNIGANIAGTGSNSYGFHFQWGRNKGFSSTGNLIISNTLIPSISYDPLNDNYDYIAGISNPNDWIDIRNDDLWGNITNTEIARKGPCEYGYHVPTYLEWQGLITEGGWGTNGLKFSNDLLLPYAGFHTNSSSNTNSIGTSGSYWSSTINTFNAYFLTIINTNINPNWDRKRTYGNSIRCFKNN